jgi:dihydropyrimidinase
MVMLHAENGPAIEVLIQGALAAGQTEPKYHALTRPDSLEGEAVHRAIVLAELAGATVYIVHVSCERALCEVRRGRERGLPVYGETCPQYLTLTVDELSRPGFEGAKYVFTPPLRDEFNLGPLWEGLASGALQIVSTDHCPFRFADQKALGKDSFAKIPNGGPCIENRLHLLFHFGVVQQRLSINRFVEVCSTTPAKLFGLYPKKGVIDTGSDADIVLWDPAARHTISAGTHHMNVDYSMFEGFEVTGEARTVLSRGEVIVEEGRFLGEPGRGRFLKRPPFSMGASA